ncbi:MAG TPA: PQQ-dependent sugar dehydrogenase [Solirubrobacteraceae bacterium]|jgi:hypothetical protein|nr:PQQ-dependent sugar dehydrogenase [Solirubrobacteraceae bacterium]
MIARRPADARRGLGILAGLLMGLCAPGPAHAADFHLTQVGSFTSPVFVTSPPGDFTRILVVEQGGVIRLVHGATVSTFLDISRLVNAGGERGLLSVAFPASYPSSGLFYVYYTAQASAYPGATDGQVTIEEFHADSPDAADPASGRVVLTQNHSQYSNHNGGQLQFGPDGYLYAGLGDGGGGGDPLGSGQSLATLLGKLIRIDPRVNGSAAYGIPPGNPFASPASGARPEIWSWGLRNPWRFSFDRATGDLTIGDVGQSNWEEIDLAARTAGGGSAANFGWNCWEGSHPYGSGCSTPPPSYVAPVMDYAHASDVCSITGGYVVRDTTLGSLTGRYLYADYCKGDLRSVSLAGAAASGDRAEGLNVPSPSSFGEDACQRVYVASSTGPVYRLDGAQAPTCTPGPAPAGGGPVPGSPAPPPSSPAPSGAPGPPRPGPAAPAGRVRLLGATRQHISRTHRLRLVVTCTGVCSGRVSCTIRAATGLLATLPTRTFSLGRAGRRRMTWTLRGAPRRRVLGALAARRRVRALALAHPGPDRPGQRAARLSIVLR